METVNAFIVFDLDEAEVSVGPTRLAPKILVDGARWMARSMTYQFASFGLKIGGASAGINAQADAREASIAAFVEEVAPMVRSRRFLTDPGKGLGAADLEALVDADPRSGLYRSEGEALGALGMVCSAEAALGSIDGASVAIEGFDGSCLRLARSICDEGGRVVAVGTTAGSVYDEGGFAPEALEAAFIEHRFAMVDHLGPQSGPAADVVAAQADVLFVGSKPGAIDHVNAAKVRAKVVVPRAMIPVTTKGLALLRRSGVIVLPDFITTAGPLFAAFPPDGRTAEDLHETVSRRIPSTLKEVLDHESGPLIGACERAEEFLATWQSSLPFGRPLP